MGTGVRLPKAKEHVEGVASNRYRQDLSLGSSERTQPSKCPDPVLLNHEHGPICGSLVAGALNISVPYPGHFCQAGRDGEDGLTELGTMRDKARQL